MDLVHFEIALYWKLFKACSVIKYIYNETYLEIWAGHMETLCSTAPLTPQHSISGLLPVGWCSLRASHPDACGCIRPLASLGGPAIFSMAFFSLDVQEPLVSAVQKSQKLMRAEKAAEEFLPLFFLLLTSCPVGAPFIMKYAQNCWVSNDLNSLSQDKTQLAKNVNNLCVDNNERESTKQKEFVFHSPQCCSQGFTWRRTATPDYPRWTHLHGDLPLTL